MAIKNAIYKVKQNMGEEVELCQISDNYMHDDIKKFIMSLGLFYTEVLRYDEPFNLNSHDQNEWKFNKQFDGKWFHVRNGAFLKYCGGIFAFITPSLEKKDAVYQILRKAKDKNMNLKLFS